MAARVWFTLWVRRPRLGALDTGQADITAGCCYIAGCCYNDMCKRSDPPRRPDAPPFSPDNLDTHQ